MLRAVAILLMLQSFLFSKNIELIKFEGLVYLSPVSAKEIIGINKGDEIDGKKISEAIKRLYSQEYFEDIYVVFEDGNLTFHFKEKPIVSKVEIKGYEDNNKKNNEIK